jgi:hypothetical protein
MIDKAQDEYEFEQKKINHIFHYTSRCEVLEKIIRNGFQPSYCKEQIRDRKYLSPMVSFCNIPIGEVDKYVRYGKNGIGMSMEWAIKNKVNPVLYIHEGSEYMNILNNEHLMGSNFLNDGVSSANKLLSNIKYWKTNHKNKSINTYQEREWRFVPSLDKNLDKNLDKKMLIIDKAINTSEYEKFCANKKSTPHFPNHKLVIESISDISYIVVTTEKQRKNLIEVLKAKFDNDDKKVVNEALINGGLSIFLASRIRDDF